MKIMLDRLSKLSDDVEKYFEAPIIIEEIVEAVKSMSGEKVPGPDGLITDFISSIWTSFSQ